MPQYKRIGHDFTMELDDANPEFWEPVEAEVPAADQPTTTEAATSAESEESE